MNLVVFKFHLYQISDKIDVLDIIAGDSVRMFKNMFQTFRLMDQVRKKYLGIALAIFILFSLAFASIFINQIEDIDKIHAENTRDQIIEIKKDFMKDTVNNTIGYIEELKIFNEDRFIKRIDRLKLFIYDHSEEYRIEHIKDYLQNVGINEDLLIVIKDPSGFTIYESSTSIDHRQGILKGEYFISEEVEFMGYKIFLGALDSSVRKLVEETLRNRLYTDVYFEDSYIWVNEVINYEGGDGYGRRLIHPNLRDTEGTLLSTDMEDIAGGKPYLEELEGIKKNGELFSTYYFKKLTTDTIEKKLTFAKLYEEYDWIVAMGIYYDNIEEYIARSAEASKEERENALKLMSFVGLALILSGTAIFLWAENKYYDASTQPLKTEVETDLLTGAGSRRAALKAISKGFESFKEKGGVYNIFVMDLDDFKQVNDTYGHEAGDSVLVRVVESIRKVIRDEDGFYRWGGEEFILFTKGIAPENLDQFMDKILKAVEGSICSNKNMKLNTTVSIGATIFLGSDESYNDAVRRADDGLYQSKRNGKNRGTIVM